VKTERELSASISVPESP